MYIFIANIIDIAFYSTLFRIFVSISTQYVCIYSTEYATNSFTILYIILSILYFSVLCYSNNGTSKA